MPYGAVQMLSIDISNLRGDDMESMVQIINEATKNIKVYSNLDKSTSKAFKELKRDVVDICNCWTGKTYVGCPKEDEIKEAYQLFFEELMRLLLKMKGSSKRWETKYAKSVLYNGNVYRYLGNGSPQMPNRQIKPIFDNIYVSWSKNPRNPYLESKLYGTVTWISASIAAPFYGIDMEELGCSRGNEREVVFPTIEKCISEIKYCIPDDE